uniref:Uncharacterized protein n=1 Tax=Anguilla anguilla TaxID=7936 RepID=A0A0E9RCL0_ANGAN
MHFKVAYKLYQIIIVEWQNQYKLRFQLEI